MHARPVAGRSISALVAFALPLMLGEPACAEQIAVGNFGVAANGMPFAVEGIFSLLGIIPEQTGNEVVHTRFEWNYTTYLNFVFLIVGWAMVGLSSYLLIGFWYQRHSAVVAARKAFVMNVIGDVGMILGTFVLFTQFHGVTYAAVFCGGCSSNGYGPSPPESPSLELRRSVWRPNCGYTP